jgi:phosphoribosylformylglycinamidine synthase
MKVGIAVFPGSNCDLDTRMAFEEVLGFPTIMLWHKETVIRDCDLVVLPGGFSYGDYLRSGAIARFAPLMEAIVAHAAQGGLVLGVCNGFQILTEAGLLPGALLGNISRLFISGDVYLKPCSRIAALSASLDTSDALRIPIAHGEGRYHIDPDGLKALQDQDRIMFRYCDSHGNVGGLSNPNGSLDDIAGICSSNGRVMGLMPHPERAVNPLLGLVDGLRMLRGLEAVSA